MYLWHIFLNEAFVNRTILRFGMQNVNCTAMSLGKSYDPTIKKCRPKKINLQEASLYDF